MQDISSFLKPIIISIFSIWLLVCFARIFVKAGEGGWKIIIPVYNEYILCKIVGKKWWFWIFMSLPIISLIWLIVSIIFWFVNLSLGSHNSLALQLFNYILGLCAFVSIIAIFVVYFLIQVRLCKVFGKSNWFCVGMIFFPFIFAGIIAFDNSEYVLNNFLGDKKSDDNFKE